MTKTNNQTDPQSNLWPAVLSVTRPGIVWALHFIAIYALISAACAPRALLDHTALALWGGAVTVVALGLCLWSVAFPPRPKTSDSEPPEPTPPELMRAAFWSGLIFAMAVLANSGALFFFQSCGG